MQEDVTASQETESSEDNLMSYILDTGELLLISGAEVMRVEDTVTRLCHAYGFVKVDVFTITSSIVLTVRTKNNRILTQTRRIHRHDTNLGRVACINEFSRKTCASPMDTGQFHNSIEKLRYFPSYPYWIQACLYAIISCAFTIFYGGSIKDAFASAISGLLLFISLRFVSKLRVNSILLTMICSAFAALAVIGMTHFGIGENSDKIIIGNIMLLIPGISLTSSLRDMINGDTISGLLGLSEAILKALAIAIGFAVVLMQAA